MSCFDPIMDLPHLDLVLRKYDAEYPLDDEDIEWIHSFWDRHHPSTDEGHALGVLYPIIFLEWNEKKEKVDGGS